MNEEKELWQLEQQFWLGGPAFYERTLAPDALMVLPQPAGTLDRATTIESIRSGTRWRSIKFTEQRHVFPVRNTAILVYAVEADRDNADTSYFAHCSSTYIHDDGRWLLVLHHQTPADQSGDGEV